MASTTHQPASRCLPLGLAGLALAVLSFFATPMTPAIAVVIFRPIPIKPKPILPRLTTILDAHDQSPMGAKVFKLESLGSSSQLSALAMQDRPTALAHLNALESFKSKPVSDFSSLLALQNKANLTLAERVQWSPGAVLSKLMPQLGLEVYTIPPSVTRRALVAMTHEDKVQVQIYRKAADLTDADVASIADDLSAIIAEGALPLDNQARQVSQIAEGFVKSATRVQTEGLHSLSLEPDQVLLRAAASAKDPLMGVRVSQVNAVREAGTVDFRISHDKFSGKVQFNAYSFATEVAKQPNSPNIEKLSLLHQLW